MLQNDSIPLDAVTDTAKTLPHPNVRFLDVIRFRMFK